MSDENSKIILEKVTPLGDVIETIELTGTWVITTNEKTYFMTSNGVTEVNINIGNVQKQFLDNL